VTAKDNKRDDAPISSSVSFLGVLRSGDDDEEEEGEL